MPLDSMVMSNLLNTDCAILSAMGLRQVLPVHTNINFIKTPH
ncbi:hypothetical protein UF70_1455 [Staphylococcus pasteuri]|nr:hypothetical protein UF70_1455 [Staphylococcus pasteuri]